MHTPLPDELGSGYRLANRSVVRLKSTNGRVHEIVCETLFSAHFPNGLHRACGGGSGWSKKYFMSVSSPNRRERDDQLAKWITEHPELTPVGTINNEWWEYANR